MQQQDSDSETVDWRNLQLPPALADLRPLTDDDFADKILLFDLLAEDNAKGPSSMELLVARALWEDADAPEREKRLLEVMWALALEIADKPGGLASIETVVEPGVALMGAIARMFLSASRDEVRLHPASSESSPCVLIFGHAGSSASECENAAKFYAQKGFKVISTTFCLYPQQLRQRQNIKLAHELKRALARGSKLLVHSISGHGLACLCNLICLWAHRQAPYDDAPDIRECLAGLVFDCAAGRHELLDGNILMPDVPAEPIKWHGHDLTAELKRMEKTSEDAVAFAILNATLGNAFRKHMPGVSWYGAPQLVQRLLRLWGAVRNHGVRHGHYGAFLPWAGAEINFLLQLDLEIMPQPVPRLFLYSQTDVIIPAPMVEGGIDSMRKCFAHTGKTCQIFVKKVDKGGHAKLWETCKQDCAKAADELLNAAGLQVHEH